MKLSLLVMMPGKSEGQKVSITGPKFLIGRDPQCQLRPASPMISKQHCALLIRDNQVFVLDLNSTNGTFVNDRQIKGEIQLLNEDRLKVGPLTFGICIEESVPVNLPTPLPRNKDLDDSAADMLLSDEGPQAATNESGEVSADSTIMEMPAPPDAAGKVEKAKTPAAKAPAADSSTAAKALLDKYLRRPRS